MSNKNKIKYKIKENNFARNNKFIEQLYFDESDNSNNYTNKSNYIIKVKTKINPNERDVFLNLENFNINNGRLTELPIKDEYYKRNQYSNNINKKNLKYYKEFFQERNYLEKIKFLQLWWKTIFQIIKIQKHLRGFLYRQRLIEELDKEEIAVDNLLFFIKSYKKIVFKIFVFRLRKHKPDLRYYLIKWNEIIKKLSIVKKLINTYNYKDIQNIIFNTTTDIVKLDYEYNNNFFLRDSTNSLINNGGMMNDNYNVDNHINDENNFCINDEKIMPSIENYSRKNNTKYLKSNLLTPSMNLMKNKKYYNFGKNMTYNNSNNINKINKINNNIYKNKFNKINKNKKLKRNFNDENKHRNSVNINNKAQKLKNNVLIKNCYTPGSNPLILSSNNKIKKRIKNNTNILNTENDKLEQGKMNLNYITGKTFKKNKGNNKLISKDIIPFSMINQLEINPKINNTLSSSNNKINSHIKKLKIYENHLQEYKNLNNNKDKDINPNIKENIRIKKQNINNNIHQTNSKKHDVKYKLKKNFISTSIDQLQNINNIIFNSNINNNYFYHQNQTELSKNINTISSFNSSYFNTNKTNKNIDTRKYLKLWHNKTYFYIIRNKLRGLFKIHKLSNDFEKTEVSIFFGNFKKIYIFIIETKLKEYFIKCKNKLIKNILIKCTVYKIFRRYKEIVFKKIILEKLKNYLMLNQKQIFDEIERDIENFNKKNCIFNYPRKKVIINNQDQLFLNINPLKKESNLPFPNINKSMLNLIHPLEHIYLNGTDNKQEYNFTEENQPFTFNPHNYKKDIDLITQLNQLTIVINLIEQLRIKNKKETVEQNRNKNALLLNFFHKWKNILNNKNIINNFTHEHTVPTDNEELTPHTINDNIQSESELGTKSDQLTFSLTSNSNNEKKSKYVPVHGVKYFHAKKQRQNNIENKKNKKYKINNLIDKYKTNTILTKNDGSSQTYKSDKSENTESNLNTNDNYKTYNDYNSLESFNSLATNCDKYMKINNLNDFQKIKNTSNIYHRKTVGITSKNFLGNNNISRINHKMKNDQYTNDSINYILDNNRSDFLGLLNNATFNVDYKIEPFVFINNNTNIANKEINYGNIYNSMKDSESDNIYGFKKPNKIEEKEICFFSNKNVNNLNIVKNEHNNFNNYNSNISIINEIKKYYNEDIDLYNNDEQKKKFNSFIINIFNNNIIMTQNSKTKRSKSK